MRLSFRKFIAQKGNKIQIFCSLKNLLEGRMMQHQSETQKIPLCVIIGPEKRGTVVNFWGMGWVQRDPFSPGVMGRKIQDLLKSVEAIHSVLTEVIKGCAESSGWIFQVLGRHHRFLSRRATQSELSFGQNTVVVVYYELEEDKCGSRESNWKCVVKSIIFSKVATRKLSPILWRFNYT